MGVLGITQQPDGGFGGAATPQSPLVSPRMGHAQSPMMQQGNATFQSSPEMNGWTQGNMNANRWTRMHTHTDAHTSSHILRESLCSLDSGLNLNFTYRLFIFLLYVYIWRLSTEDQIIQCLIFLGNGNE